MKPNAETPSQLSSSKRNYKTTAMGILMLVSLAITVYQNPSTLLSADVLARLAAGIGMIAAADGNQLVKNETQKAEDRSAALDK